MQDRNDAIGAKFCFIGGGSCALYGLAPTPIISWRPVNNNATRLKGQKIDPFTPFYIRLSTKMVRATKTIAVGDCSLNVSLTVDKENIAHRMIASSPLNVKAIYD